MCKRVALPAPSHWRLNCDGDLLPLVCVVVDPDNLEDWDVLAIDGQRMSGVNHLVAGDTAVNLFGDILEGV